MLSILNILLLTTVVVESFHTRNVTTFRSSDPNDIRSGGFPKFPSVLNENHHHQFYSAAEQIILKHEENMNGLNSDTCGTRSIKFYPKRHGKIIGGHAAPYGAFPWQVEIQLFNYEKEIYEHHCGGAVIGERLVLTAAHCTEVRLCVSHETRLPNAQHWLMIWLMICKHWFAIRFHSNRICIWWLETTIWKSWICMNDAFASTQLSCIPNSGAMAHTAMTYPS